MPVRSLDSSVLAWPDVASVRHAVGCWAELLVAKRRDILRVGYFGSYARGTAGVGSDLDLVAVVRHAEGAFPRSSSAWDLATLATLSPKAVSHLVIIAVLGSSSLRR